MSDDSELVDFCQSCGELIAPGAARVRAAPQIDLGVEDGVRQYGDGIPVFFHANCPVLPGHRVIPDD